MLRGRGRRPARDRTGAPNREPPLPPVVFDEDQTAPAWDWRWLVPDGQFSQSSAPAGVLLIAAIPALSIRFARLPTRDSSSWGGPTTTGAKCAREPIARAGAHAGLPGRATRDASCGRLRVLWWGGSRSGIALGATRPRGVHRGSRGRCTRLREVDLGDTVAICDPCWGRDDLLWPSAVAALTASEDRPGGLIRSA